MNLYVRVFFDNMCAFCINNSGDSVNDISYTNSSYMSSDIGNDSNSHGSIDDSSDSSHDKDLLLSPRKRKNYSSVGSTKNDNTEQNKRNIVHQYCNRKNK